MKMNWPKNYFQQRDYTFEATTKRFIDIINTFTHMQQQFMDIIKHNSNNHHDISFALLVKAQTRTSPRNLIALSTSIHIIYE